MAAFTRITAETILVNRLGPIMAVAEMAVTIVGTNGDLDDGLAWATRGVGGTTANYNTVTDAELALVATADLDDLTTLAEWRTLKNIQGALNAVDITTGPRSEKFSQFKDQVQQMMDNLEPTIEALGALTEPMSAGYISLDIAEHGETRL
jgi:hypothetical protein